MRDLLPIGGYVGSSELQVFSTMWNSISSISGVETVEKYKNIGSTLFRIEARKKHFNDIYIYIKVKNELLYLTRC